MKPKVSVIVITFNHKAFLAKALSSVLSQVVNFDFEVVVSDDCSTDGTQEIIKAFYEKYPNKIVPLLHPKNLGGYGKNSTLVALAACKGSYIAALDGDDYWTNPHKLQRQADFLDANPTFSGCFHNAEVVYDNNLLPPALVNPPDQKAIVTAEDMVGTDEVWFIATSAFMFRNGILTHYPKWFHESKSGDIPRYVLLTKWGPIGYLNEVMSVYRKNPVGLSFTDSKFDADYIRNRLAMFKAIDAEYSYQYHHKMRYALAKYYLFLAGCHGVKNKKILRAFYAFKALWLSKPNSNSYFKAILLDYVLPDWIQKMYSRVKWTVERSVSR